MGEKVEVKRLLGQEFRRHNYCRVIECICESDIVLVFEWMVKQVCKVVSTIGMWHVG